MGNSIDNFHIKRKEILTKCYSYGKMTDFQEKILFAGHIDEKQK